MNQNRRRLWRNNLFILGLMTAAMVLWLGLGRHEVNPNRPHIPVAQAEPEKAEGRALGPSELIDADQATRARINNSYGKLPLSFEANKGQADSRVKFMGRGNGYTFSLASREVGFDLRETSEATLARSERTRRPAIRLASVQRMKMSLVGAQNPSEIEGENELSGKVNYFLGSNPEDWHRSIPTYERIRYRQIYPGVDLIFHGNNQELEYDFVVNPGSDPNQIRLEFTGVKKLRINESGDLVLTTKRGDIRQHKPVAYQDVGGTRKQIAADYSVKNTREVVFSIGNYDTRQPLVIDPVLGYSTYLGGAGTDVGYAIAVDSLGNAYVTGVTTSLDFPTLNGFQTSQGGQVNAFITKLTPNGELSYSTYLGGNYNDGGTSIAVDSSGNAYITGYALSRNFPTLNAFQSTFTGSIYKNTSDAFVAKLTPSGALSYSTYLGGTGDSSGISIAVDSVSNAYVTGYTNSLDFPTQNAYQAAFAGSTYGNAFVTKFTPTGGLSYSTYLGGSGGDAGLSIAVDLTGNAYITGITHSSDFPILNAFQPNFGGNADAFVAKMTPSGGLSYSTYLGGNNDDVGYAIAVDSAGSVYVTGLTGSPDFPTLNAFQSFGGFTNSFVTKLTPGGTLSYSTYFGGIAVCCTYTSAIAVDSAGKAYITGRTSATDFPIVSATQATFGGYEDAFVSELTASGALSYSTYLGGKFDDIGYGIAVDSVANIYVTGLTNSSDFPLANAAQGSLGSINAGPDAFVTRIISSPIISITPASLDFGDQAVNLSSQTQNITITNAGDPLVVNGVTITGANASDFDVPSNGCSNVSISAGSSCAITVTFTPSAIGGRNASLSITDNASDSPQTVPLLGNGIIITIDGGNVSGTNRIATTQIDPSTVGEVPGGFAISGALAYQIVSTGSLPFPLTLGFVVPSTTTLDDFANLRILHQVNNQLIDVTTDSPARNYATKTVYAVTASLSPFYLARRVDYRIVPQFDQTKAFKIGSTIPIKLQLQNSVGANISSSSTVLDARSLQLIGSTTASTVNDAGNANPDNNFRFDSGSYIFNLKTGGLTSGTYSLDFYVGSNHSFFAGIKFQVK